jgi:hypothetical protein
MDFLNHREEGMVFYQVFLLSPLQWTKKNCRNCKRLREFKEKEISRSKCCSGGCEWKEGKFLGLVSGFRPRIRPQFSTALFVLAKTFMTWRFCFFKSSDTYNCLYSKVVQTHVN